MGNPEIERHGYGTDEPAARLMDLKSAADAAGRTIAEQFLYENQQAGRNVVSMARYEKMQPQPKSPSRLSRLSSAVMDLIK
jgi:hypothetical protein